MKTRIEITLGNKSQNQCEGLARESSPRIKNWRPGTATTERVKTGHIVAHNLGRYSSRCTYTHYEYTPVMQSWGVVCGNEFAGRVGKYGFRLVAPNGYIFASDSLGAKLASRDGKRDYHFNSDELIEGGIRLLMLKLRANQKAKSDQKKVAAAQKREQHIFSREVGSCRVTLADSRRAGNCVEGSLRYAELRLGISRQSVLDGDYLFSVSAKKLLESSGDDSRAQSAVRLAWMRETMVQI